MDSSSLPSDIVYEILGRASLETLDKSRSVSKDWNKITYEPSFMQLHHQKTYTISGFYVQSIWKNRCLYKFVSIDNDETNNMHCLPPDSQILASSSQGILCCISRENRKNNRFYVCKPSTRQVQMLPNPKMRYVTEKVALALLRSKPLRYKIIRLSEKKLSKNDCYNYKCQIFDSETWAWKEPNEILLPRDVHLYGPSIFANGAVHWLTDNNQILAIDAEKETYTTFPLPELESQSISRRDKELVKYKGQVGFIYEAPAGHFEIWAMEDYKKNAWKKIDESRIDKYCSLLSPAALYNSETALMKEYNYVMFYNFRDSSSIISKSPANPREIFAFRSDLEPVDLRGGARGKLRQRQRQRHRHRQNFKNGGPSKVFDNIATHFKQFFSIFYFLFFPF